MRNTTLTSDELPETYTYNGTSHSIEKGTTGYAYWNYTQTGTKYNDWTTAGLQYWLNGADSNGYYGTLSSGAQALVDTNYTYFLGNLTLDSRDLEPRVTTIGAYNGERDEANITSGNYATWNKASNQNANGIALLYPSDYGYSVSSSYWNSTRLHIYDSIKDTSWMNKITNNTEEWLLSPVTYDSIYASVLISDGYVAWSSVRESSSARPVLNLLASAPIDINHTGDENDPYILILD